MFRPLRVRLGTADLPMVEVFYALRIDHKDRCKPQGVRPRQYLNIQRSHPLSLNFFLHMLGAMPSFLRSHWRDTLVPSTFQFSSYRPAMLITARSALSMLIIFPSRKIHSGEPNKPGDSSLAGLWNKAREREPTCSTITGRVKYNDFIGQMSMAFNFDRVRST